MTTLRKLRLPTRPSPHLVAAALTRGGVLRDDFFLYRGHNEMHVVGDWIAAVTVSGEQVTLEHEGRITHSEPARDPLAQAGRLLRSLPLDDWTAYGYIAFDLARYYFSSYALSRDEPSLRLCVPRLSVSLKGSQIEARAAANLDHIAELLSASFVGEFRPVSTPPHVDASDRAAFCRNVEELRTAIRAGNLEKAILSRRHAAPGKIELLETYAAAARVNRSPRSFCFRLGNIGAVGFSPEILLKVDSRGRVVTNPLAGTRPRGASPAEDARLRADLFHDSKEVKEHALSVLLAQQELRSVCRPKTVGVTDFMNVKKFHRVQHLSSVVRGNLAPGRDCWDAIRAIFPAVTVSGIPKPEALHWIAALEGEPRGVYGGAVGWIDSRGRLDLALAIRTAFQYGHEFQLAAGAGIIAESQPDREYTESVMKMNTIAEQLVLTGNSERA